MVIEKYGVKLKRLEEQDIEMVRLWRNSEHVKQYMEFKDYITIEMQKKWFNSLNQSQDYFFIIYHHNYPVGLTEIKHITDKKTDGNNFRLVPEKKLPITAVN